MTSLKEIARISLPKNLRGEDQNVYDHFSRYKIKELRVIRLKNVFVTHSGIVLKNFLLVQASVSAYLNQRLEYQAAALYNYLFKKRGKLSNGEYLLIHNPWCPGHFAWIGQALERLWQVKNIASELTLILPESFKSLLPSLEPFSFKDIYFLPKGKNVLIGNLVLPSNPLYGGEFVPEEPLQIRDFYLEYFTTKRYVNLHIGEYVYVSRGKAKYRKITNENKLIDFLKSYNFSIINFEDYDFWEQVSIMYHCKVLISMHGAGFANIQFMKKGGCMLEFINEQANDIKHFRPSFFRLSSILEIDYYYQWCKPVDDSNPYDVDLEVDIQKLNGNLSLILKNQSEKSSHKNI